VADHARRIGPIDVLVTGGAGFVGAALVARLRAEGATVVATDVATAEGVEPLDVTAGERVLDTFERLRPRVVVHAAAIVDDRASEDRCQRVNVGGTENVVDAAATVGIGRLVHISSVAALGLDPGPDAGPDSPLVFDTGAPYFDTKAASEALVRDAGARGALPVVVVRPGDVWGPRSEPWVLRPLGLMRRKIPILMGGGEGLMAHCWIDNLVAALLLAVEHPDAPGGVFQVTDGVDTTTYRHYLERLAEAAGLVPPRFSIPRPAALAAGVAFERWQRWTGGTPPFTRAAVRYICRTATYSTSSSREILGYAPHVGLEEGFDRLRGALRGGSGG